MDAKDARAIADTNNAKVIRDTISKIDKGIIKAVSEGLYYYEYQSKTAMTRISYGGRISEYFKSKGYTVEFNNPKFPTAILIGWEYA